MALVISSPKHLQALPTATSSSTLPASYITNSTRFSSANLSLTYFFPLVHIVPFPTLFLLSLHTHAPTFPPLSIEDTSLKQRRITATDFLPIPVH